MQNVRITQIVVEPSVWVICSTCQYIKQLVDINDLGKISTQPHTIVKQICFPMAMYCFCHCFLYPRTEGIMQDGAVRKFYLLIKSARV